MSAFHGLLRSEVLRAAGSCLVACVFTFWAACGFPLRGRRFVVGGHSPLQFDQYSTFDASAAAVGLLVTVVLGCRAWRLFWQLRGLRGSQGRHFFARAVVPRTVYGLLLAVASRDGEVGVLERDVVRRLLTRELPERVLPQDLDNWVARGWVARDPLAAARSLASALTPEECATVMRWCRELAAADGRVGAEESELLRSLATVLSPRGRR